MQFFPIADWDDVYTNADYIPDGAAYPVRWSKSAKAFRSKMKKADRAALDLSYGPGERQLVDVFYPRQKPAGLVVFVHGGYWMRFDKSSWSHFAQGALHHGFVVAMPSYTLCPKSSITDIGKEIAAAIEFVSNRIKGPIRLAGHSAGGQLVARMVSRNSPLANRTRKRVVNTVAISPVSDLRSLTGLKLNDTLQISDKEAQRESPALLRPMKGARITCWVGAGERSEFIRQNLLLACAWQGLGAQIQHVEEPDRHHFNVIDGLSDPDSLIIQALLA